MAMSEQTGPGTQEQRAWNPSLVENDLVPHEAGDAGSLADYTYIRLREEIISTELPPGALLREDELRQRFGVGRTPIREALQLLRHNGFVTILPRRGTLVTEINITDLASIYEVRVHLEAWAARLAAERASHDDIEVATKLIQELLSTSRHDHYALLSLDRRVHRLAYRCTKNDHLASTLEHYQNLSLRILNLALKRYPALIPRLEDVVDDQQALLQAICRGDGESAETVAREHVLTFERSVRELI
jgi:DNA-binding GntR family transcriptional regulator